MGGLAGIVNFRGDPPDQAVLERMSAALAHRGPDGEGTFVEGPVALAHRRRAIVPTRSVQPLVAPDLVLLLDGWIYDHERWAAELGGRNPGDPDTYTLLEAWRRWGLDLTGKIEGAYAVAIWDRQNRTLHLLRDQMGARPLYWARHGAGFAFSSELPSLLEVPWVSREIARDTVAEYLSFRVVHSPRTLLRDVHQVEPAHWLRVNADEVRTHRYWTPKYAPEGTKRPSDGEIVGRLQEAVEHAVSRRLVPGATTALYLSGGLGSTAIAAASRRLQRPMPTWTLGFADDPNPEAPIAGRVARLLGLDHHEVVVGSADLAAAFEPGVRALGHPIGNPAAFLQLLLARAVGSEARVVLSGDGGEELFGGRMLDGIARSLRFAEAFAKLPMPARKAFASVLSRTEKGRRVVAPVDRYGLELGLGGSDLFGADERRRLLRDADLARPGVRREVLAPFYADLHTDPVNAVLHAYLRSWLQEESLPRADRTAAAAGLDVRFPLLDHEVFAMAAALPGSSKLRRAGGSLHTRWPLRAMLDGVLPPPLVHRPKRGMPVPLDPWLAGPGRLFLEERFQRLQRDPHRLWNPEHLRRLRKDVGKKPGIGLRLWSLFIFDAWTSTLARG
jgi:asparagine synthase (glutamine-hydrolysing)